MTTCLYNRLKQGGFSLSRLGSAIAGLHWCIIDVRVSITSRVCSRATSINIMSVTQLILKIYLLLSLRNFNISKEGPMLDMFPRGRDKIQRVQGQPGLWPLLHVPHALTQARHEPTAAVSTTLTSAQQHVSTSAAHRLPEDSDIGSNTKLWGHSTWQKALQEKLPSLSSFHSPEIPVFHPLPYSTHSHLYCIISKHPSKSAAHPKGSTCWWPAGTYREQSLHRR